jgi:redox-sensitive bicupin YhaK (pirin superfamily)
VLRKAGRSGIVRDNGGFVVRVNMPGWMRPIPNDHGHGPLAMVVESFLSPGRAVAMHEHCNDEIISWVPDGVMRHDDKANGQLVTDRDHLMVMNAGRSFWHSEETLPTDPPLRMLQILVRPRAIDLEAGIQHGPIAPAPPNTWRHLFGPEDSGAPFFVRNSIDFYDARLEGEVGGEFPTLPGRHLYFYVFTGAIAAGGKSFVEAEQGLWTGAGTLRFETREPTVMVAFLIDANATVMRAGTVGDIKGIPPPIVGKVAMAALRLRARLRERFGRTDGQTGSNPT